MKYIIYLFPVLFFTLNAGITWAEPMAKSAERVGIVKNTVELDITMEMLDEDAEAASDIVNVIELPLEMMQQEQLRNELRLRQTQEGGSIQQEQGTQHTVQSERSVQMDDAPRLDNDAPRLDNEDMGSKKGR